MRKWAALLVIFSLFAEPLKAGADEPITRARIDEALRRYRHEPSVQHLVRAAIATRARDPGRARDAIDRARLRGLVPTVRGTIRRGHAIDLRNLTNGTGGNLSTDDDLMLEARVSFQFERLVFASEEVGLLRELRALEAEQLELVRTVIALYFERRRLQLEGDLLNQRDVAKAMRILEIEALLDAFTAGEFTRIIAGAETERP